MVFLIDIIQPMTVLLKLRIFSLNKIYPGKYHGVLWCNSKSQ